MDGKYSIRLRKAIIILVTPFYDNQNSQNYLVYTHGMTYRNYKLSDTPYVTNVSKTSFSNFQALWNVHFPQLIEPYYQMRKSNAQQGIRMWIYITSIKKKLFTKGTAYEKRGLPVDNLVLSWRKVPEYNFGSTICHDARQRDVASFRKKLGSLTIYYVAILVICLCYGFVRCDPFVLWTSDETCLYIICKEIILS